MEKPGPNTGSSFGVGQLVRAGWDPGGSLGIVVAMKDALRRNDELYAVALYHVMWSRGTDKNISFDLCWYRSEWLLGFDGDE